MKSIGISSRFWTDDSKDGIGVYGAELHQGLNKLNVLAEPYQINYKRVALSYLNLPSFYDQAIRKKFSLLHVTDYVIPKIHSTPIIATLHDAVPLQYPEWASMQGRSLKNYIFRSSVKYISHAIAVSKAVVGDLVNYWNIPPEKISVVHSGVAKKWFVHLPLQDRQAVLDRYQIKNKYLLFVGTLQPRKNIERVIKAFRLLPTEIKKEYSLILIGKRGWKDEKIQQEIRALTSEGCGRWLNYVPAVDLLALYQGAEIFLFPSLYEGFGIPILEAFASGIPVITSNISSMPEVAGDAALLVDPYSIEAIKQGIIGLIENEGLRKSYQQKGSARAEKFTWEECARNTIKIYEQYQKP